MNTQAPGTYMNVIDGGCSALKLSTSYWETEWHIIRGGKRKENIDVLLEFI